MEHRRWVAERILAGWRFSPGPRNSEKKTSPYLVDWDNLDDSAKEWDFAFVRYLPRLLTLIGKRVQRRTKPR